MGKYSRVYSWEGRMTTPRRGDRWVTCLGVDPGVLNTGYALVRLAVEDLRRLPRTELHAHAEVLRCGVIRTPPGPKRKASKAQDRADRMTETIRRLMVVVNEAGGVDLVAAETFQVMPLRRQQRRGGTSKGALGITNAGIQSLAVFGAMVGLAAACSLPFMPVHPSTAKAVVMGRASTSKAALYEAALPKLMPAADMAWPRSRNEHVGDSYAVGLAGLDAYRQTWLLR